PLNHLTDRSITYLFDKFQPPISYYGFFFYLFLPYISKRIHVRFAPISVYGSKTSSAPHFFNSSSCLAESAVATITALGAKVLHVLTSNRLEVFFSSISGIVEIMISAWAT